MPVIRIDMLVGKTMEQKQKLILEITNVVEDVLDVDKEAIKVILTEVSRDHWAVGGITLQERAANQKA